MIDMIYVNHFVELRSRKEYLDKNLTEMNLPFQYRVHTRESDDVLYKYYDLFVRSEMTLTKGIFSLTLSHLNIYMDIIRNNYSTCLILEDDAVFSEDFLLELPQIVEESKHYDFSFLSDCCSLHKEKTSDIYLYESDTSRGGCGYLVTNNISFKNMMKNPMPITDVIDWHLNNIKKVNNLKYSWCEPPVIVQGTENNFYKSNLR